MNRLTQFIFWLGIFIITSFCFVSIKAIASPWLPDEGRYLYISSGYIFDKTSIKTLKQESKIYYALEQDIVYLERKKKDYESDKNLTSEAKANRAKKIDDQIKNIRRIKDYFSNYYTRRTISQSVEYGVNPFYSFGAKVISQEKVNFLGHSRSNIGAALFQKIKLKQTDKYIASLQPLISIERDIYSLERASAELRLLLGKTKKHRFGKAFDTIEIAPGISKGAFECKIDYTTGLELKNGTILMLQTYNSFRPKANKVYRQTSLEQFSIAKPLELENHTNSKKVTLQLGYFKELSISARKTISSGFQLSLWVEV
jgi:hypothetical protein